MKNTQTYYDAIIIGSGFGGCMVARQLVNKGIKVLMLERGDWVLRGPHNWEMNSSLELTPHYSRETPLRVKAGGNKKVMGLYSCVGGPSVFYGGVSFRFREKDFEPNPDITIDSGAEWPYTYQEIEPYYSLAEKILGVSGESGVDPTEPFRSSGFPQSAPPLSQISGKIRDAARKLDLRPFQLPLAINYEQSERKSCASCTTCDTFACAIEAKNDLATVLIPKLLKEGMELRTNSVATRLIPASNRITEIEVIDRNTGERQVLRGEQIILSAGSLASPHLLLSSGLQEVNPAGKAIGRYLMRHINAIVFGIFPGRADKEGRFHKQIGILDYYFGHPDIPYPRTKLGSLQQVPTPPAGLVQNEVPGFLGRLLGKGVPLLTGLLAIAEDQPQFKNHITIDTLKRDTYGLPQAVISHYYSKRDKAALKALTGKAKKILKKSGALTNYVHHIRTFSHSVGTVRMGKDPNTAPLDEYCQFRGLDNLYVADGSFMPTSAGVNPSLTISANALRVGDHIAKIITGQKSA